MPLALRADFDAARQKQCARRSGKADQVRRFLAHCRHETVLDRLGQRLSLLGR